MNAWHGLEVIKWGILFRDPRPQRGLSWRYPTDWPAPLPGGLHPGQSWGWVRGSRTNCHWPHQVPRPVVVVPGCTLCTHPERAVSAELAGTPCQPPTECPLVWSTAMHVATSPACLAASHELVLLTLLEVWLAHNLWSMCRLLVFLTNLVLFGHSELAFPAHYRPSASHSELLRSIILTIHPYRGFPCAKHWRKGFLQLITPSSLQLWGMGIEFHGEN